MISKEFTLAEKAKIVKRPNAVGAFSRNIGRIAQGKLAHPPRSLALDQNCFGGSGHHGNYLGSIDGLAHG
jgi:hypothetical protein